MSNPSISSNSSDLRRRGVVVEVESVDSVEFVGFETEGSGWSAGF